MNLNLTIEVNEEQFSDLCQNTLENLPEEKLQEILLKSVELALLEDKHLGPYGKGLLMDNKQQPTKLMRTILEKADFGKYFEPIAGVVSDFIVQNYKAIIVDAVAKAFIGELFTDRNRWQFEDRLLETLRYQLRQK